MPPRAITDLYRASQIRSDATMLAAGEIWRGIDPRGDWAAEWARLVPRAVALVGASQLGAAVDGIASVPATLEQSGFPEQQLAEADPRGFVGWMQADSGEMVPLVQALHTAPLIRARQAAGTPEDRLSAGEMVLLAIVQTAVADAARHGATAQGAATARTVNAFYDPPPMCQRCAVIVGRTYKWGTQFARHPRCDGQCVIMSDRDSLDFGLIGPEDVTDLTQWQRDAIEDGADFNQTINAQTRPTGGRTPRSPLSADGMTTSATRSRRRGSTRPTPKAIYAEAGDSRERAIELLRQYGYIL